MNVPARIYASEKLLKEMDAGVFEQVTNVACLPGIQKYSFCMPDGHWGYGFPIGGVAAFDVDEGIISPGGIGFDINCLHPQTKILTEYGYHRQIRDFEHSQSDERLALMNTHTSKKETSKIALFLKKKADNKILKIKTSLGNEIIVSEDHPLLTPDGFIRAGALSNKDSLVVCPFEGVPYEEPADSTLIDEERVIALVGKRGKLIKELKEKGLLPLRSNSPKLPILAKLVGFLTGDGWIGHYYSKKREMDVWSTRAIGDLEDLKEIQKDFLELGYSAKHISTNECNSTLSSTDGTARMIKGRSSQLHLNSQSLSVLMHLLGVPKGNKSRQETKMPTWVHKSPLWIKRLYIAGLFGAELSKPLQRKDEPYTFVEPSFSQNKINSLERSNLNFLLEVSNLLLEFGINTNKIYRQEGVLNSYGEKTHKLSLKISSQMDNLIALWGKIGFEYCSSRKKLSMGALAYLAYRRIASEKLKEFISLSKTEMRQGISPSEIYQKAGTLGHSLAMVKGQLYRETQSIRANVTTLTFEDYVSRYQLENSEFVTSSIEAIAELDYKGDVYDFTMKSEHHNFIANSIVSHNCGMRLVTTNLTYKEVQPRLKELIDTLFKSVPAGVGCKGFVKVQKKDFIDIIETGSKWCVENGYGWKDDVERTEGYGVIDWADHTKVSDKAMSRGIDQLGTLGSGNHYLEAQVAHAKDIFDPITAKAFGIHTPDQVVVMVHCGSRGFGHQIGTDYLRIFEGVMQKYKIEVRDRELTCAPFQSKEGQDYYKAMACAANMAFANRQVILHRIRESFEKVFKTSAEKLEMNLVYDVAHNIAKLEEHEIDGKRKKVVVHRKGSTRAFPPNHPELCNLYRKAGQPIIIGGSMETGSHLLVGTEGAMKET
ncbi:MAG TPA: RtcB family protein, partial [Candidatus Nanoarchaeia archaeon]|nr:RtcB family protein [Candidatus Nanoarchaeia archaeon]